jgi:hypothetical protein
MDNLEIDPNTYKVKKEIFKYTCFAKDPLEATHNRRKLDQLILLIMKNHKNLTTTEISKEIKEVT